MVKSSGNVLGAGFIKAVLGPLPHALMVPTVGQPENLDHRVESGRRCRSGRKAYRRGEKGK